MVGREVLLFPVGRKLPRRLRSSPSEKLWDYAPLICGNGSETQATSRRARIRVNKETNSYAEQTCRLQVTTELRFVRRRHRKGGAWPQPSFDACLWTHRRRWVQRHACDAGRCSAKHSPRSRTYASSTLVAGSKRGIGPLSDPGMSRCSICSSPASRMTTGSTP